ncbi:MAG: hypothetical protein J7L79_03795 [Thaumarchaeota archaeon]|nr:hypothetical protein [Nitrososphaerota archaeon]
MRRRIGEDLIKHRVRIGLVTLDLRLAALVRKVSRDYRLDVVHVASSDELPLDIEVVIAKRAEGLKIDRKKVLYQEDFNSMNELIEDALELAITGLNYRMAVVAIDPGKSLGAAYLLDSRVIKTKTYGMIEELIEDVKRFLERHERAERKYVVVGAASGFELVKQILKRLERRLRGLDATIIVCDESFTSKGILPKIKEMSKDEYSALILSLKNILRLG